MVCAAQLVQRSSLWADEERLALYQMQQHPASLRSVYHYANTRSLIVWGAYDEVQPVSTGYLLEDTLPGAQLVVVPGAKHSVQLERPVWTAEAIRSFIESEPVPTAPRSAMSVR